MNFSCQKYWFYSLIGHFHSRISRFGSLQVCLNTTDMPICMYSKVRPKLICSLSWQNWVSIFQIPTFCFPVGKFLAKRWMDTFWYHSHLPSFFMVLMHSNGFLCQNKTLAGITIVIHYFFPCSFLLQKSLPILHIALVLTIFFSI